MSLRDKEIISVWELYEGNDDEELTWRLRQVSNEFVGTKDELKYFRMINEHGKHFFNGPSEYLAFSGADPEDSENCPGLKEIIAAWTARVASRDE